MPRGRKKTVTAKILKATPTGFQNAIREAAGAQVRARNAAGNKSTALSDFATRSGFSGGVLSLVLRLNGMEDLKRTDFIRQFVMAFDLMGWGRQSDLFDDVGTMLRAAEKAAEDDEVARQGKPKGTAGLPLDEATKKFEATAHLAPNTKAEAETVAPPDLNPTRKRERQKAQGRVKGGPADAMRESTKGDAHLRAAREGTNPLPGAPAMGDAPARTPETVG